MEFKKPVTRVKQSSPPRSPQPQEPALPPLTSSVKPKTRSFLFTKKAAFIGVAIITAIALWSAFNQYENAKNASTELDHATIVENLEYQTVLPDGKSISGLGGWRRVSPSESDPVYAYLDTLENIPISVSQQPIPSSFKGSADDQVAEVAKKFNATTKLDAGSTKVYIGTSAKGPQSVILTKNSLLILIKSQEKISDKVWIKYITSLN